MNERLFTRLADWLADGPVVLAEVVATRGATPRKAGARMLVRATDSHDSIGGGLAEARVLAAARELLEHGPDTADMTIELSGGPQAAGVCGGTMQLALRRWHGAGDRAVATTIAGTLAAGRSAQLPASHAGTGVDTPLPPDPRLLIVGAGHCGHALAVHARLLAFAVHVFDERSDCFDGVDWPSDVTTGHGDVAGLAPLLDGQRRVLAVLLNRDFASDVRTLAVLAERPPSFIGMMGSRRRIHTVLDALPPDARARLTMLQAPVGLEIGAETPHEIAISVLAQLVQQLRLSC